MSEEKKSRLDVLTRKANEAEIVIMELSSSLLDMKNRYEYLIDYLLDRQDIKQLKEVDMTTEEVEKYVHLLGSYFMSKDTLLPTKIESIFKGWILNKEQSDLVTGNLVYDNIELGSVTAKGFTKEEVSNSLRESIKALKPKSIIITDI